MFSEGDEHQGVVLGVLFGVIALVIALVIGLGIYQTRLVKQRHAALVVPAAGIAVIGSGSLPGVAVIGPGSTPGVAVIGPGAPAAGIAGVAGLPGVAVEIAVVKIFYEPGQTALPESASGALANVAQEVVAGKTLSIGGWYDAAQDAANNADVAQLRALNVRDALASLGVPPDRIAMRKPEPVVVQSGAAADAAQQARRVEVRVH